MDEEVPTSTGDERSVPRRRLVLWCCAITGAILLTFGVFFGLARSAHRSADGRLAPPFVIPSLTSRGTLSLNQFQGRPVVLNFWRQACTPCTTEEPVLARATGRFANVVSFAGVDIGDVAKNSGLLEARASGMNYPMGFDPNMSLAGPYGVVGTPVTVFINADGTIKRTISGPLTDQMLSDAISSIVNSKI